MKRLKKSIIRIKNFIRLLNRERKSVVSTTLSQKIHCYSRGFLSESSIIYNFKVNNSKYYLTDYARYTKAPFLNIDFGYLIDNKFLFDLYFSNTIKGLGLICSGVFYGNDDAKPVLPVIYNLLRSGKSLVIKPLAGGGGFGILFVSVNKDRLIVNGKASNDIELLTELNSSKGYILYNHFNQKGFSHLFYPPSLNTLRVVTMIDPKTKQPFIPIAVHRFGTKQSGNVDNWSNGGLSANINIETGFMGKAVAYPVKGKLEWHSVHPDSRAQIEGIQIPVWNRVKEMVLSSANKISMIPYIGWDVVISDNDIYILEANTNSDVNLLQVHKPLLLINGVTEFFNYHKVL